MSAKRSRQFTFTLRFGLDTGLIVGVGRFYDIFEMFLFILWIEASANSDSRSSICSITASTLELALKS